MEAKAFENDDDAAYDDAKKARQRNDQAYFLYLFTRLEDKVNAASTALLDIRLALAANWEERRIWQAWSRGQMKDIPFLSKVEVLTDKGQQDYATIKNHYDGRNAIAHGGFWQEVFIQVAAQEMEDLASRFIVR